MKKGLSILLTLIVLLAAAVPVMAYSGFPTFSIESVVQDKTVTIKTNNLPPNDNFTVTMGKIGTRGVGGVVVDSTSSGEGGSLSITYNIPESLMGLTQIAIRMQSPATGYFAYNWFWNNTATVTAEPTQQPAPTSTPTPTQTTPGYSGFPTFTIAAVDKDKSVSITGKNFPANDTFTVLMGDYGTKGVGGIKVGSTDSGSGGSLIVTYNIPESLAGKSQIAIRLESSTSGYFAYNWFWNR